jgi:hypothetical protein
MNVDNSNQQAEELARVISDENIEKVSKRDFENINFDTLPDNFNFLKSYLTKPRTISEIIHREKKIQHRRAKNKQAAKARAKNRR